MKKVNMKFQYPIKFQINKTNHYIRIVIKPNMVA